MSKSKNDVKRVYTGLSPEYIKSWTLVDAVREILQNYLDSNVVEKPGYVKSEKGLVEIRDFGSGLKMKHLLLGISEKDNNSRGQFGEGLKLAMLVFARRGKTFKIYTGYNKIEPKIFFNPDFEDYVLTFEVSNQSEFVEGTKILVRIESQILEKAKNYFIEFRSLRDNFKWVEKDCISLPAGELWVNKTKVGSLSKAKYSYHLYGDEALNIVNRDRSHLNNESVEVQVKNLFLDNQLSEAVATVYSKCLADSSCWEYSNIELPYYSICTKAEEIWKAAVDKVFGLNMIIASSNESINRHVFSKGYNNVRHFSSWAVEAFLQDLGYKTAKAVVGEEYRYNIIESTDLKDEEKEMLSKTVELVTQYYKNPGKVFVGKEVNLNSFKGLYNHNKDYIIIERKVLKSFPGTLFVLLHETAHKVSDADDLTSAFENELCKIATNIILNFEI